MGRDEMGWNGTWYTHTSYCILFRNGHVSGLVSRLWCLHSLGKELLQVWNLWYFSENIGPKSVTGQRLTFKI
jgi:hypothetical protein